MLLQELSGCLCRGENGKLFCLDELWPAFGFIEISPLTPSTRSKIQNINYFGFTHVPLKFISAPRKDKHFIGQLWQLFNASNLGAWTQAWQAKWAVFKIEGFVCERFLPFFPNPPRSSTSANFRAVFDSCSLQKRLLRRLAKCSSKRRVKISILSREYCSDFLDLEILRFLWS